MILFPNAVAYFLIASCYFLSAHCEEKPNIILIITDDQDSTLGGMIPMKNTQKLIGKHGTTFSNSFVASPICCPSRSSILTGMHVHNHGTRNNSVSGGCYGENWRQKLEPHTFANILQKNGSYVTFYAGKYLNQYGEKKTEGPERVPPGWTNWRGLVGNSVYYNFTLSFDGKPKVYDKGEYLTDILKYEALTFIDVQYKLKLKKPFLMVVAPPAPHAPYSPAPRHKTAFEDVKALITPNFNIPAGDDKHWLMRMPPSPLPNSTLEKLDQVYRSRWQALLSVDEMVESIIRKLENYKIISNTYIIFTSDNGYHIGQFSQPVDKRQPYETDIRVPLIIRGPNIEADSTKFHPIINVDLAPTILKMAGIEIPGSMDGQPIPIFNDSQSQFDSYFETNELPEGELFDREMLIEYHGEGSKIASNDCPWSFDLNLTYCNPEYSCKCEDSRNNTYNCVRHLHPTINFLYCAFKDLEEFEEAYDISNDPYQMDNIIGKMMPAIKFKYQNILNHLITCKGSNCYNML